MNRPRRCRLLLLALSFAMHGAQATAQSSANFSLARTAINNGVGAGSSASFSLQGSVGDAVATGTIGSISYQLVSGFRAQIAAPPAVVNLLSVFSRKLHNGVPFELTIDHTQPLSGTVSVEPRAIGAGHVVVFRFDGAVTSAGAATALDAALQSAATVTLVRSGTDVIATLSNVADNQRLKLTLGGVNGGGPLSASMGFLVGDVSRTGAVTAADLSAIKAHIGLAVNSADRARFDLNADGSITQADVNAAKARAGKRLAP